MADGDPFEASFPSGLSLGGDAGGMGSFSPSFGQLSFGAGGDVLRQPLNAPLPDLARGEEPGSPFGDFAKGILGQRGKAADRSGVLGGLQTGEEGFGSLAKSVMPFAQLGLAGLGVKGSLDAAGASRRQARNLEQAQQMQREATQPLQQFGTQQLQRAAAGQVDPATQALIDQWTQNAKLQAQQWFAHNKITDSTMMESVLRDIDQKAVAMKAGDLKLMEQMGVGALGQAAGAATQGAQTAQTEQSQLDNLIRSANSALAAMLA